MADVDIYNSIMDGQIGITPFNDNQLQPASYDVRLGDRFISYPRIKGSVVPGVTTLDGAETTGPYLIQPLEFVLATTKEYFKFPNGIVGELIGKSSLARLGLVPQLCAGFCDSGFEGEVTLELVNHSMNIILLTPGMQIAQMVFYETKSNSRYPYGHPKMNSKYQKQTGPTEGRYDAKS